MKKPTVLSRDELYERVWSKPMSVLAREFGLTGNALAKICSRVHVPYPSRGHWMKVSAGTAPARPALPADPGGDGEPITISAERANSRRTQTRLSREARREQLIAVAAAVVEREGTHAASMKRIARDAGVSETQAYNYFRTREALLVELARRELRAMRDGRKAEMDLATDHYSRLSASIRGYLKQVEVRGGLLQTLLRSPEVRLAMRRDHRDRRGDDMNRHASYLVQTFDVSKPVALACTSILTSLSLRAGRLVASRKLPAAVAERLCIAMTEQGSRDTVKAAVGDPT
ncbi:MAG: TetR family transcriptional regulator [Alphaproteobacteria bacterium]|nr:TetR family transcriptional regulator [Alphaproteobacteria bacterium]